MSNPTMADNNPAKLSLSNGQEVHLGKSGRAAGRSALDRRGASDAGTEQ